jgi:hypothetical protein
MANALDTIGRALAGPPDKSRVMELKLKMVADSGNDAVLKQLTTQVHDAFDKMVKDTEHLGEKLVKKSHGWAKSIGESMSKALDKASAQLEKLEAKASSESEAPKAEGSSTESHESKHYSEPEAQGHPEPSKPSPNPKSEAEGRSQEAPQEKKSEEPTGKEKPSRVENALIVAEKGVSFSKHVSAAFDSEKGKLERAGEAVDAAKDAHEVYKAGKELYDSFKGAKTAASVANTTEKVATATGLGGTIKNLGSTALAGLGGWGGIGAAAQIAGFGAVAVAGGVALHDGFKLLLNKVGFLGGNFDTLSGTVMEWNESTKRSAEIEKKIAETQEAHQKQLEQLQRNEQNTRSVYEAKDRIEESQKFQHEAAEMVPIGARYAQRLNGVDPNNVGSARELHEQDQNLARDDRKVSQDTYAQKLLRKQKEQAEAADIAQGTKERNLKLRQNQGGVSNPQKEGEGGIVATTVSLQEQLLQEEKSLKLANEMRTMARERTVELGNQLAVMEQQVRAAEHQKAAAQEQVKAEKERELSDKARMSMLSKGDQQTATGIFKNLAHGQRIDRKDAIFLQEHGLTSGTIQHKVNDRMAEDLDPEFVKWRKAAGGEEALDNAQQHLAESTRELAQAQQDAKKTLNDYMQAVQDFAHTSDRAVAAQEKVETTKSDKEGYSNPYALRPGEKPHQTASAVEMVKAAIQAANADSAKALKEIADAVVNGAKQQAAEASRNAQRAKEANNP